MGEHGRKGRWNSEITKLRAVLAAARPMLGMSVWGDQRRALRAAIEAYDKAYPQAAECMSQAESKEKA